MDDPIPSPLLDLAIGIRTVSRSREAAVEALAASIVDSEEDQQERLIAEVCLVGLHCALEAAEDSIGRRQRAKHDKLAACVCKPQTNGVKTP
jgi:hypothetical protein